MDIQFCFMLLALILVTTHHCNLFDMSFQECEAQVIESADGQASMKNGILAWKNCF